MASIASDGLFSVLPDEILHQILHSLTLRQRTIASLVSTKWRHMIASFDDSKFVQKHSTNRYCAHCNQYKFPSCHHCDPLHPIIKLAADNSFTEIYLSVPRYCSFFKFSLETLESRLLTVLHLKDCNIKVENFGDINVLPSLKEIYFDHVYLSSANFSTLINKCPSIVELTLIDCRYSISVPDVKQLKKVHVSDNRIEAIEIAARNLQEFHLFSTDASPLKLDLCTCTKLQVLKIDCEYIPVGFPEEIFSSFPCLRSLFLHLCRRLNKIKLLSPQLENLTLSDMVDLQDAIIVTPNLRSLTLLNTKKVPSSSPVIGSRLTEAEIGLKYVYATNSLPDLRTFAENLGEKMTLSLSTNTMESKEVRFHRSMIQPLGIKHINLEILFSWLPRYESFIDELFSYFHPKTLLVRVNSDSSKNNFIQVLLDTLKSWEKKSDKCYKCSTSMCWRCLLKDFKILASITKRGTHQISFGFQWSY